MQIPVGFKGLREDLAKASTDHHVCFTVWFIFVALNTFQQMLLGATLHDHEISVSYKSVSCNGKQT
jgi:uncharacterized membrane protein (DUF485 family)